MARSLMRPQGLNEAGGSPQGRARGQIIFRVTAGFE